MSDYGKKAYQACLYGNADSNQQQSAASQVILLHAQIGRMTCALEQWKCPACGGTGNYLNKSNASGQYEETTVPCTKCGGIGLHPIAITALRLSPHPPETEGLVP